MIRFLEQLIVAIWNRLKRRRRGARFEGGGLDLGFRVTDGQVTRRRVTLSVQDRMRHVVVLGKTGSGKSYLLRHMSQQDIEKDRGFIYFDLHGDATPFLMQAINARERRETRHLSGKLILIDPADPIMSVGLNPLEQESPDFVRIAEVAEILKRHWALDHFGARTDELLRNALFVLAANLRTPFFGQRRFRVLVVANSPGRMLSIRKVAAPVTDRIFWFSDFEAVKREGIFGSIWLRPREDQPQPLFRETP